MWHRKGLPPPRKGGGGWHEFEDEASEVGAAEGAGSHGRGEGELPGGVERRAMWRAMGPLPSSMRLARIAEGTGELCLPTTASSMPVG